MKFLKELMVLGDDGGMAHHIDKAIKNMEHHGKNHKSKSIRDVCTDAVTRLKMHTQNPNSMYDDPHTFLKVLSNFHGEPDELRVKHATDSLGSYTQTDND